MVAIAFAHFCVFVCHLLIIFNFNEIAARSQPHSGGDATWFPVLTFASFFKLQMLHIYSVCRIIHAVIYVLQRYASIAMLPCGYSAVICVDTFAPMAHKWTIETERT